MNEALERARAAYGTGAYDDATIEFLFPEVKESEDEMNWKAVLEYVKDDALRAWLEKKKEQKTDIYAKTEIEYADKYSRDVWDKLMSKFKTIEGYSIGCNDVSDIVLNAILNAFKWERVQKNKPAVKVPEYSKEWFDEDTSKMLFIQSLERVEDLNNNGYGLTESDKESWWKDFKANALGTCQQPAEWSEDEIGHLYTLARYIKSNGYEDDGEFLEGVANKLKSLRPQPHWKPTYKQMAAIEECLRFYTESTDTHQHLKSLLSDLKDL